MKKFTVSENCTLKNFAEFNYPRGAFALSALLKKRDVKVNGTRVGSDVPLKKGDEVIFYTTPAQERAVTHVTVYEDENITVCDKYSGVTSEGLLCELCESGEYYAVHRLDRNTCGLIVFARTAEAESLLLSMFRKRSCVKIYLALCKNAFRQDGAKLKSYLVKDASNSLVKVYDSPVKGGSEIVTEYKVLEKSGDLALVEVILHTGKTHQIRAHMSHIGCPVLGDEKYGDGALNKKYGARRQRLVAKYLMLGCGGVLSYLDGRTFESSFMPEI